MTKSQMRENLPIDENCISCPRGARGQSRAEMSVEGQCQYKFEITKQILDCARMKKPPTSGSRLQSI